MTEKISKRMLDGVQFATGSVMAPVVKSQAGKSFLSMVPGEVLLASLDAVSKYHCSSKPLVPSYSQKRLSSLCIPF